MVSINGISHIVQIGLRITGIWQSPYWYVSRFAWTAAMTTAQVLQYWYIIKHLHFDDLINLVDSVSTTLPYTLLFYKLIMFWRKHRLLKNMLTRMAIDWANSSTVKFDIDIMLSKAEISKRCTKLIMGVYMIAVIIYSSIFIDIVYELDEDEFDVNSPELLIKMKLPFKMYKTPIYECVFLVQLIQLTSVASAIALLNSVIVTLVLHFGGQIEILHQALSELTTEKGKGKLSKDTIKRLINAHYRIIVFSEDIENLFSSIALMQLVCNTIIICCIGFVIIVSFNTDQNVKVVLKILFFYIAITLEAFIFCFAGEYLSNKSTSINEAVYDSHWYLFEPNDNRAILLLMVRAQKRLTITAGKYTDLSLESFANMLKTSASYISVLHAMY